MTAYRKAGPIRRGHLRRASFWLGDDHALLVTGTRFFEKYRRFYYAEIQAITVRRARRLIVPVYSTLAALVFGILLLVGLLRRVSTLELAGGIGLAAVVVERYIAAMFRSCYTHIYTSVSSTEIPSLCTFRSAAKAVASLEARIQQAQGPMPDGWQTAPEFESVRIMQRAQDTVSGESGSTVQSGQGRWAAFAFIGLILYAVVDYLYLRQPPVRWMGIAVKVALLVEVGACLYGYVELYRERKSTMTGYLLLGAVFFVGLISYAENLVLSFQAIRTTAVAAPLIPIQQPGMAYVAGFSIGGSIALGIAGLLTWLRRQPAGLGVSGNLSIIDRT